MTSDANPLLSDEFRIPFHRIAAEHVEPGIRRALEEAQAEVDAVASDPAPPTWENTIGRLDRRHRAPEQAGRPGQPPRGGGRDAGAARGLQRRAPRDVGVLVPPPAEPAVVGADPGLRRNGRGRRTDRPAPPAPRQDHAGVPQGRSGPAGGEPESASGGAGGARPAPTEVQRERARRHRGVRATGRGREPPRRGAGRRQATGTTEGGGEGAGGVADHPRLPVRGADPQVLRRPRAPPGDPGGVRDALPRGGVRQPAAGGAHPAPARGAGRAAGLRLLPRLQARRPDGPHRGPGDRLRAGHDRPYPAVLGA